MADELDTPVTEAVPVALSDGALLEAVDADGWNWRVLLISAGTSANGNRYPLPMLHEAAPAYNGVPVFYGRGPDHSPDERGFDSVAGYIVDPKPHPRGLEGTFEISPAKPGVREAVRHAWQIGQRTGKAPFGFSHVIPRDGFEGRPVKPRGFEVTRIKKASSVDLVMSPAAGGGLIAPLSEAESYVPDALQEAIVTVDQLLERLRSGNTLGPDDFTRLAESVGGAAVADAIEAGRKPAETAIVHDPKTDGVLSESTATKALDALTESVDKRIAEVEQRAALAEARATLTATLAEAKLPDAVRTNIAADFDGRIFEAADLTARIERDRAMAAQLAGSRITGLGVAATQDETDTHKLAMDGFFGMPNDKGVKPFRSLKEAYIIMCRPDMSYAAAEVPYGILREARGSAPEEGGLAESVVSSTFSNALGDSITRRMIAMYNMPQYQSWRNIVSQIVPLNDFRTQDRIRFGGYGVLPVVNQGAPYQPLTTPADQQATYALSKHGGTEDLTLEAIANDDVGLLRQIPMKLGRAGIRSIYTDVWINTIAANATATYDSTALYHANHANLGTTALSAAELLVAENAMRNQTAYGETQAVLGAGNQPKFLVIPNALRNTAFQLVNSPVAVGAGTYSAEPNIFQGTGYQIIVVDEFTDANNWFLFADPQETPMLEVGFFGGNETPELFVQDQPTVGSAFTADKVTYKIRYIYGIGILDHRGTYRESVA